MLKSLFMVFIKQLFDKTELIKNKRVEINKVAVIKIDGQVFDVNVEIKARDGDDNE
jgi:hypothetical protein